jgi:Ca2+-binding EF-hand superfamily protein
MFADGLLFRRDGLLSAGYQNGVIYRRTDGVYGNLDRQDEIFCLANETNVAKLCLKGDSGDWRHLGAKPVQVQIPFWKMPANLLPSFPAALRQSDLYILEDRFTVYAIVNKNHQVFQEYSGETNEYNAALLCYSPDLPLPQKIYLKFDSPDANTPTWIFPTTNLLFLGSVGRKPGVWIIPISQLDSAIAAQKKVQLEQMAKEEVAVEQARKNFMAKSDLNHNGVIDPDEREAALDVTDFIESELDVIDANHNDRLDSAELAYFDANTNKILEPKEQAGIEIAQHLLAGRLLKKYDANGDGFLDRLEFDEMTQSFMTAEGRSRPDAVPFLLPDDNHDGKFDLGELETFLKHQTQGSLQLRGRPGPRFLGAMSLGGRPFKLAVEAYWQNLGGATNPPSINRAP